MSEPPRAAEYPHPAQAASTPVHPEKDSLPDPAAPSTSTLAETSSRASVPLQPAWPVSPGHASPTLPLELTQQTQQQTQQQQRGVMGQHGPRQDPAHADAQHAHTESTREAGASPPPQRSVSAHAHAAHGSAHNTQSPSDRAAAAAQAAHMHASAASGVATAESPAAIGMPCKPCPAPRIHPTNPAVAAAEGAVRNEQASDEQASDEQASEGGTGRSVQLLKEEHANADVVANAHNAAGAHAVLYFRHTGDS